MTYAGVFYYTLANISPSHRSAYQCIQLLAVAHATDVHKYGVDSLLSNYIESLNKLSSVSLTVSNLVTAGINISSTWATVGTYLHVG